jgi:hypothetical protein
MCFGASASSLGDRAGRADLKQGTPFTITLGHGLEHVIEVLGKFFLSISSLARQCAHTKCFFVNFCIVS